MTTDRSRIAFYPTANAISSSRYAMTGAEAKGRVWAQKSPTLHRIVFNRDGAVQDVETRYGWIV
jgi:hypothetical protein